MRDRLLDPPLRFTQLYGMGTGEKLRALAAPVPDLAIATKIIDTFQQSFPSAGDYMKSLIPSLPNEGDLYQKGKVFRLILAEPIEFNHRWLVAEGTKDTVRARESGRKLKLIATGHLLRWLVLAKKVKE